MSSIVQGIGNLFASVFEIIQGVISTIVNTITTTIQTAINAVIGLFSNLFNLAEGVVGLVLGNFVLILVAVVAYFGFIQYQKSQGRRVEPITDKAARKMK